MIADPVKMKSKIKGFTTVSDQIRALDRAGYKRADIAKFLGKRYQQVRNVLVGDEQVGRSRSAKASENRPVGISEPVRSGSDTVRVDANGRVQVPARIREALDLKEGDALFARLEGGEIHLLTPNAAMRRAQALVRQFVPEGVSLVDELIADRRREVEQEGDHG